MSGITAMTYWTNLLLNMGAKRSAEMNRIPKRRAWAIVGLASLAAWAVIGLTFARGCGAAEATLQSARPWTLGQCDRLAGRSASAVFNRSLYSRNGWPLWGVVCIYPKGGSHVQRTRL